jgi:hypothetical protein
MARGNRKASTEFLEAMDLKLDRAIEQLQRMGFRKSSWKRVLREMDFNIGVSSVVFDFTKSIGFGFEEAKSEEEKTVAFIAYGWAQVAALTHSAKFCKNPRQLFAIGHSIGGISERLQSTKLIKMEMRKLASRGGLSRRGKFALPTMIVIEILKRNAKATLYDVVACFSSDDIEDVIDSLGPHASSFAIVDVDKSREIIEYSFKGISKSLRFSTVRNILSKKRKK